MTLNSSSPATIAEPNLMHGDSANRASTRGLPLGVQLCLAYNRLFSWRFRDRAKYYRSAESNPDSFRQTYFDFELEKTRELISQFGGVSLDGLRVLDFGCLYGGSSIWYARNGAAQVVAVDVNAAAVAFARETIASRFPRESDRIQLHVSTDTTIPIQDNSVDIIISEDVVEHLMDPPAVLAEWWRILSPGGRVLISFGPLWFHPHGVHLWEVLPAPWNHVLFTEQTVSLTVAFLKGRELRKKKYKEMGMNQMTLHCFEDLVRQSRFKCTMKRVHAVWRLKPMLLLPGIREFFASQVECVLTKPE